MLEEARVALPALQSIATAKAGEEGVHAVIKRRFPQFPQPERSAEDWRNWWADYYETLSHVPLASLEAGMRAYVATPGSEFMPKPWKLLELSDRTPSRSLGRYQRAKRALQFAEESLPAPEIERVDPAAVKEMLAEFQAKSVGAVKKPELPSISGVVDERGVTPEMRALIARRSAA